MTTVRRIVLGFASGEECRLALETALGMARDMKAELVGILARDEALAAASGIPCVSVRSRSFSRWEVIDERIMKRALSAEAGRLEALIASGAKMHNVHWSFRTVSPEHVAEDWSETDILLLPRSIPDGDEAPSEIKQQPAQLTRHIMRLERAGYRVVLKPAKKQEK